MDKRSGFIKNMILMSVDFRVICMVFVATVLFSSMFFKNIQDKKRNKKYKNRMKNNVD